MMITEDDFDKNDSYRIIQLSTGQVIIGNSIASSSSGIVLRDPVSTEWTEDHVFFNLYLNGLSRSRNFFFPALHILSIAYVEQNIKDCYDEYIEKTLPEKIDLQLANTDIKVDSDTIH
jgi:hypothetical protein